MKDGDKGCGGVVLGVCFRVGGEGGGGDGYGVGLGVGDGDGKGESLRLVGE